MIACLLVDYKSSYLLVPDGVLLIPLRKYQQRIENVYNVKDSNLPRVVYAF